MKYKYCPECGFTTQHLYFNKCTECKHPVLLTSSIPDFNGPTHVPDLEIEPHTIPDIEEELAEAKRNQARPKSFTPLQWVEYENNQDPYEL